MKPQMALNQVAAIGQDYHSQKAYEYCNVNYLVWSQHLN